MLNPAEQAAANAIFVALEERHTLTAEELALRPAELAARRALAAARSAEDAQETADGWEWMLVEVLGHRRHTGRVREEERFGAKLLRVDVPVRGDPDAHGWQTHYYAAAALYGLTPCTREAAMKANRPYEAPSRLALAGPRDEFADDVDENGDPIPF